MHTDRIVIASEIDALVERTTPIKYLRGIYK